MTVATANLEQPRCEERSESEWAAECLVGTDRYLGTVHDLGNLGFFFHPELSLTTPEMFHPSDGLRAAVPGTAVTVRLLFGPEPHIELRGRVRWSGFHHGHGRGGFGAQLISVVRRR